MDDYGVETPNEEALTQAPKEEEKKEEEVKAAVKVESEDEEEAYGEGADFVKPEGATDEIIDYKAKSGLNDILVIFREHEFFLHDYSKKSGWQLGDFDQSSVPESASVVEVIGHVHNTHEFRAIISGGFSQNRASTSVSGLTFGLEIENQVESYTCNTTELQPLSQPRYHHQSVIVKDKAGKWQLLVIGGKGERTNWLNSVESLELSSYFRPVKGAPGAEWKSCAPLNSARSNFAVLNLDNVVYVFGGIEGRGSGLNEHKPQIVEHVIEKYQPVLDTWEHINVPNVPRLAAFAWTKTDEKSQIAILGGTDGQMLTSDLWVVDFKLEVPAVIRKDTEFEFATGMGKLFYRGADKTLHHIGGLNSSGVNYWQKCCEKGWTESERKHSFVANESALELTENSHIYFH